MEQEAIEYARRNKKRFASELTSLDKYPKEEHPASFFMAGSPGAGKTETAEAIIGDKETQTIHIDPDKYRSFFSDYDGSNSFLFNSAVSIITDAIHDKCLANNQTFIFDSTASNFTKMKENMERSLKRKRDVIIIFVYQSPLEAWDFVKKREKIEGRRITKEVFIEHYFNSRLSVNKLKEIFKEKIIIHLVIKDLSGKRRKYFQNVTDVDYHIRASNYTKDFLTNKLCY